MEVGDGEDRQPGIVGGVNDAERESGKEAAPDSGGKLGAEGRERDDSRDRVVEFLDEPGAEAGELAFVPFEGVVELGLGELVKADVQRLRYLARASL